MGFIPVNEPLLDGNEKKYLQECIDTGWISSEGPFVERFETEFAAYCGRKHGIAVCNGTAALETAAAALGIGPGDEVIMPSFTIISCAIAVIRTGAKPVFVDSDPYTWNMDVSQIESRITERTKAIMAVHVYGLPAEMNRIESIAGRYGLKIIEDAAEQIGQTCFGKTCGSFGDVSAFSFYPNKHITTGEGGMVLTDSDEVAGKCRSYRNLCFRSDRRFVHTELGYNFRMTNLQAALGVAQLERISSFIKRKREIGAMYDSLLKDVKGIRLPLPATDYAASIYWVYGVVLEKHTGLNAREAMKQLAEKGIGTRPFFYPLHSQPVLIEMGIAGSERLPVAEELGEMGFYLPSGLALKDEEIVSSAEALKAILG